MVKSSSWPELFPINNKKRNLNEKRKKEAQEINHKLTEEGGGDGKKGGSTKCCYSKFVGRNFHQRNALVSTKKYGHFYMKTV